jgi:modulator of FtsH protease HflK
MNDPQWGKKGNEGPPDLDEIFRRFNRRVSDLFGGRGRRPSSNAQDPGGGGSGKLGVILLLVVLLGWLASGFYIVDASSRGIVMLFGRYKETTEPGPHWRWPWPFEKHEVVTVSRVHTVEVGYRNTEKAKQTRESLMLTDDLNIIDIQFAVQYIVKDPKAFLFNNRADEENKEDLVRQAAETALREVVGKNKMDYVINEGRSGIAAAATKVMQQILDRYETGINISKVTMQNAQPPEQVQAAFDDANKAGQDRERQRNEGQAYSNDVLPKARGAAARLMAESNGYKQRIIASAEGDASRFKQILTEYQKAPQVTRERMYLDMMQQVLGSTSKVMVDQKSGGNLLYLPLDKLIQGGSDAGAPAPESSVPRMPEPPPLAEPPTRSRESFRSRERESR